MLREPLAEAPSGRETDGRPSDGIPLVDRFAVVRAAANGDAKRRTKGDATVRAQDSAVSQAGTKKRRNSVDCDSQAVENKTRRPRCAETADVAERAAPESSIISQLHSFLQASDNKLALKLFGSKNAVLKEQQRQLEARSWIIHPCSNFKLFWDVTMLIVLATNLVVLPVSIAFFHDDESGHWMFFNLVCDVMFFLDIIFNFRTGIVNSASKTEVILDAKLIAIRYLRTWFAVDFVSSFPLDYVFLAIKASHGKLDFDYTTGRALRILRLAKLLQLLRILRISRLLRYIKLYQEFFSMASTIVRIFNLICVMVLLSHWSGCIQFFVPALQGWPEDSWIVLYKLQSKSWWEQYSVAMFKALSHMLCIGYGQFAPINITDTWLTMLSMLAGASCYAMLVGHTTALIQSFDVSSKLFRSHLQQVNEYMIYRKLPSTLRKRITNYYDHRYGGKMFNEAEIMSQVSENLKQEITLYNCRKLLETVPFFTNDDDNFVEDVIMKLKFEFIQPGDVVIPLGSLMNNIYFIQEGWLEVCNSTGNRVTTLGYGSYFGEIGLLTRSRSSASIRAVTHCNLFSVTYDEFEKILMKYPTVRRTLQTVACKRLHDLGEDPGAVASRESLVEDMNDIMALSEIAEIHPSSPDVVVKSQLLSETTEKRQLLVKLKKFFTKESAALPMASFSESKVETTSTLSRVPERTSDGALRPAQKGLVKTTAVDALSDSVSSALPRSQSAHSIRPSRDVQACAKRRRSEHMRPHPYN